MTAPAVTPAYTRPSPARLLACIDSVAFWLEADYGFTPERAMEAAESQAHRIVIAPGGESCALSLVGGTLIPGSGMERIAADCVALEKARSTITQGERDAIDTDARARALERLAAAEEIEPAALTTETQP